MISKDIALLFPPQGAHHVDMLKSAACLPCFDRYYQPICAALNMSLIDELKKHGEALSNQNVICSLLTVLVSIVYFNETIKTLASVNAIAGHSIGTWSALYIAGSLSYADLIQIVITRGQLMDRACPNEPAGMMACVGVDEETVQAMCYDIQQSGDFVAISAYNAHNHCTLSGTHSALKILKQRLQAHQARQIVFLPVSGPWHCALLRNSVSPFLRYLQNIELSAPAVKIINNVTGQYYAQDINSIKLSLADHLCQPVCWRQSISTMIQNGCERFLEVGYGHSLTKMGFFIDRHVTFSNPCV